MKQKLLESLRLRVCLLVALLCAGFTGAWGQTTEEINLSSGTYSTNHITWSGTSVTVQQLKGTSATAVNSNYIEVPRAYKGHILSFEAKDGYKISSISIKVSGTYYGNSMTAGTAIDNNTVTDNTSNVNRTWTSTSGGTHVVSAVSDEGLDAIYIQNVATTNVQLRFTAISVTYITAGDSQKDDCDLALTGAPVALTFDLYDNANPQVINYTTSSTGAVTVDNNEYVDAVVDALAKTITVTPKKKTSEQEISVKQAADDNYKAGSATFNVTITDNKPVGNITEETIQISDFGLANGAELTENEGQAVTLTWSKGSNSNTPKAYNNGEEARFYKDNTLTFSSTKNIIQITFTYSSGYNGNNFTASIGSLSNGVWTGSATEVTLTNGASDNTQIRFTAITITYEGGTAAIPAPVFSPASGVTFGNEGIDVALAQTNSDDIYYTLDGTDPTSASTKYTAPIHLTTTTTIKAVAYNGTTYSSFATATYTYEDPNAPGSENNPYSVAQARAAIDANSGITGVYATGIVSEIVTAYNSQYGNITYNISVDGSTEADQLQAYRGKGENGADFTSADDIQVGDIVVIYGNLKKYNDTYEFDANNQLVSLTRPVTVPQPTFSPAEGAYFGAQQVTLSVAAQNTLIYYTTDGTEPTNQSTRYTSALTIDATTTIKAVAYDTSVNTYSAVVSATYTIRDADAKGSPTNPYWASEALTVNPIEKVYVKGIVSEVVTAYDREYYATYYISDDGTKTNQFEVYRGKGLNNSDFMGTNALQVGDEVVVFGNIVVYSGTNELGQGNYLYSFNRPVVPTFTLEGATNNTIEFNAAYERYPWGGTYAYTVENYSGSSAVQFTYCDASGNPVTDNPSWFDAQIDASYFQFYCRDENTSSEARYGYVKMFIEDAGTTYYSDLITVKQKGAVSGNAIVDEITLTTTGVTGTSYTEWSSVTVMSDAVYAGQSAGGNDAIQLRSSNSNSGIITTTSGGLVQKIEVIWNSNTTDGRTINIYGSHTAYTAASDLYNSSAQGSLLGTIVKGESTLSINDDYEYIGIRSDNGALYLDKISITWAGTTKLNPELAFSTDVVEATIGVNPTLPTLNAASGFNGTVEYSSSDDNVAKIMDIETGDLRLIGEGTTTITATFAGDNTYKAGSASYTLNVTDNRIATTTSYDNIELNLADVATLTRLAPVVKDANDNVITYSYDAWPTEMSFEIVSDDNALIGGLDNNTGEITLNSVVGTATLKASYNAYNINDTYKPSECTFTITVVDPSNVPTYYALVAQYDGKFFAMNEKGGATWGATEVDAVNGKVVSAQTNRISWEISPATQASTSKVIFRNVSSGKYLNYTSSASLSEGTTSANWDIDESNHSWTNNSSRSMVYRENANGFKNYAVSNINTGDYSDYTHAYSFADGYVRTVTANNYGTFCVDHTIAADDYSGVKFYSIAGKIVNSANEPTSIVLKEETGELLAGVAYIFQANDDATKLVAAYSDDDINEPFVAADNNGLAGSFTGTAVDEGKYLLSSGQIVKCGTGCSIGANRAYIDMEAVPVYNGGGNNVKMLGIDGFIVDGIDGINGEIRSGVIYNIAGQRLQRPVRGINIINGKKVLVK